MFIMLFKCHWVYRYKTSTGIIFLLLRGIKSDDLTRKFNHPVLMHVNMMDHVNVKVVTINNLSPDITVALI